MAISSRSSEDHLHTNVILGRISEYDIFKYYCPSFKELGKKFNSSVFPGLQGGPLMHVIAAKAVAFGEALQPEFKQYIQQVKKNASVLGEVLMAKGIDIVTGGTDSHMVLVDLRSTYGSKSWIYGFMGCPGVEKPIPSPQNAILGGFRRFEFLTILGHF